MLNKLLQRNSHVENKPPPPPPPTLGWHSLWLIATSAKRRRRCLWSRRAPSSIRRDRGPSPARRTSQDPSPVNRYRLCPSSEQQDPAGSPAYAVSPGVDPSEPDPATISPAVSRWGSSAAAAAPAAVESEIRQPLSLRTPTIQPFYLSFLSLSCVQSFSVQLKDYNHEKMLFFTAPDHW